MAPRAARYKDQALASELGRKHSERHLNDKHLRSSQQSIQAASITGCCATHAALAKHSMTKLVAYSFSRDVAHDGIKTVMEKTS